MATLENVSIDYFRGFNKCKLQGELKTLTNHMLFYLFWRGVFIFFFL